MLHKICTKLRPGYLTIRVGDSSQCSVETVKKIQIPPLNGIIIIIIIIIIIVVVVVVLLLLLNHISCFHSQWTLFALLSWHHGFRDNLMPVSMG